MGKFLVKDKLAEIPVSNDQNTCLLPGDCQDILIGKTSRMIARDCVRGKKVLFFASKLREPVKTEKSGARRQCRRRCDPSGPRGQDRSGDHI